MGSLLYGEVNKKFGVNDVSLRELCMQNAITLSEDIIYKHERIGCYFNNTSIRLSLFLHCQIPGFMDKIDQTDLTQSQARQNNSALVPPYASKEILLLY